MQRSTTRTNVRPAKHFREHERRYGTRRANRKRECLNNRDGVVLDTARASSQGRVRRTQPKALSALRVGRRRTSLQPRSRDARPDAGRVGDLRDHRSGAFPVNRVYPAACRERLRGLSVRPTPETPRLSCIPSLPHLRLVLCSGLHPTSRCTRNSLEAAVFSPLTAMERRAQRFALDLLRSRSIPHCVDKLLEAGTPSGDRPRIQRPCDLFRHAGGIHAPSEQVLEVQLRISDLVRSRCVNLSEFSTKEFSELLRVGEVPRLKVLLSIRIQDIGTDPLPKPGKPTPNRFHQSLGIRPIKVYHHDELVRWIMQIPVPRGLDEPLRHLRVECPVTGRDAHFAYSDGAILQVPSQMRQGSPLGFP